MLFTSRKYFDVKKFVRELKLNLKYDKVLNKTKIHSL